MTRVTITIDTDTDESNVGNDVLHYLRSLVDVFERRRHMPFAPDGQVRDIQGRQWVSWSTETAPALTGANAHYRVCSNPCCNAELYPRFDTCVYCDAPMGPVL